MLHTGPLIHQGCWIENACMPQMILPVWCALETTGWCCWPARVWRSWKTLWKYISDHWGNEESSDHRGASPWGRFLCVLLQGDTRWAKPLQLGSIPNHIYLLSCVQSRGARRRGRWRECEHRRSPTSLCDGMCVSFVRENESNVVSLTSTSFNMSLILSRKWGRQLQLLNVNDPMHCGCALAARLQQAWQMRNIMLQFTVRKKKGELTRWIDFFSPNTINICRCLVFFFTSQGCEQMLKW